MILLFQSPSQFSPSKDPEKLQHRIYASVEMTSGHVRFSFDMGKTFKVGVKHPVDDGKWHSVSVSWTENYVTVSVDDVTQVELLTKSYWNVVVGDRNSTSSMHDLISHLDSTMHGDLFLGGLANDGHEFLPKKVGDWL